MSEWHNLSNAFSILLQIFMAINLTMILQEAFPQMIYIKVQKSEKLLFYKYCNKTFYPVLYNASGLHLHRNSPFKQGRWKSSLCFCLKITYKLFVFFIFHHGK